MKKQIDLATTVGLLALCSSAYAQFIPGGVDSAGLTYVVPDMAVWYNNGQLAGHPFPGYVTNGPVNTATLVGYTTLGNAALDNGRGDEFVSVVADSTFLIGAATFADDGSWNGSTNAMAGGLAGTGTPNQRHIVVMQPAGGGAPKIGEAFFDDSGAPYRMHTSLRQKNNAVRVAGDPRLGGKNFITLAMASLWYGNLWFGIDYFNSDGRFDPTLPLFATGYPSGNNQDGENVPYPGYSIPPTGIDDVQMGTVQTFSVDPATLVQTPLSKAQTSAYGDSTGNVPVNICNNIHNNGGSSDCSNGGGGDNWMGYLGGVVGLDNGNFVSYVSDPSGFFGSPIGSESAVATIFRPDGTVVKGSFLVEANQMNANIAAYRGGFCIRVRANLYFYDNAGNLLHTTPVSTSGMSFDTGSRGDGTRLASNIGSHYVYLAGPAGAVVLLGVWDAQTGAFVDSAIVNSDLDASATVGNANVAVDALDRVCVAFAGKPTPDYANQIMARVMKFDGNNVKYLTPTFFPFVSADNSANVQANGILGYSTVNPAVAMTTHQICIAALGSINSANNPAGGPDADPVNVYVVITQPPFIPGGVASAGVTNIVADTLLWFSLSENSPKIGGFVVGGDVAMGGSVEAYAGLLGDSTFLLAASTYADDGASMRFTAAFQPAAGGAAKVGDLFYDDTGKPYISRINESRQDGNPGRAAGDLRYGAVNIMGGGEVSLWAYPDFFNSDGRFDQTGPFYGTLAAQSGRDACVQCYSLNPLTLAQTMLCKAQDSAFGRCCTNDTYPNSGNNQLSRFGGHIQGLDNGNFVSVVEDRSNLKNPSGNASVATIFRPDGSIVKEAFKVADGDQWANVAAYRGGFCVRPSGGVLYFFDNDGNLQGSVNHNDSSGLAYDTGRGDGTRSCSDIRSHYVYLAGVSGPNVMLSVWDARTAQFITSATISETDPSVHGLDRVNVAVDALNRVCVTYKVKPVTADFPLWQIAARVLAFDGTSFTYLTPSFFPFVNHDEVGTLGMDTEESSVAMTTRQIFVYAEGAVNCTNNPAAGPNTQAQTHLWTVISHPAPVDAPRPNMTIKRSGSNAVISYQWEAGLFQLQARASIGTGSWAAVTPQPALVEVGDTFQMTVPITGNTVFLRLIR
jgi:hypothetical protein